MADEITIEDLGLTEEEMKAFRDGVLDRLVLPGDTATTEEDEDGRPD